MQSQCKPNAELKKKLVFLCTAEVQPDFATQCQCKPNAELKKKLVFLCTAEVQPDFATQCQCKPNAERRELALKSYAEVQPDFATQRYKAKVPFSKFFDSLISHLESFPHPKIGIQPFIYGLSRVFSTREKNEIGM